MTETNLQTCINCGKLSASDIRRNEWFGRGQKAVLIEDVPMVECYNCGIVYLTPETSRMIDEVCTHAGSDGVESTAFRRQQRL